MASLREIRRRIKSVKNTSQITRAMQMVASAKMRRAQERAVQGRPYIRAIAEVFHHLRDAIDEGSVPLMQQSEKGVDLVVIVTTDRGLCGGLNSNLLKFIRESATPDTHYVTIGRKLNTTLLQLGSQLDATWSVSDPPELVELKPISDFLVSKFLDHTYKTISFAFSAFYNTMVQRPMEKVFLPVKGGQLQELTSKIDTDGFESAYLLEPDASALLETLIPLYLFYALVQVVLEGRASEHSARMVAMKGATENAKNLIQTLTRDYNKERQTQITNELLEITTAMKAME